MPNPGAHDGHARGHGRRRHAGRRADAVQQVVVERRHRARALEAVVRDRQREGQQLLDLEAHVDARQADEPADGEAAAREKRQREPELDRRRARAAGDDGRRATLRPDSLSAALMLKREACHAGASAEQDARQRHGGEGEEQDRNAEPDVGFGRQRVRRHQRHDRVEESCRQRHAEHAADDGEDHALGDELADDDPARGAAGAADGQLALPRRAASEHEVRDVRARDEQHERHRAEQQPQAVDELVIEEIVLEQLDAGAPSGVRGGELGGETLGHGDHVVVRLGERDVRLQPAHDENPVEVVVELIGREGERHPRVVLEPVTRSGGQHADDRGRLGRRSGSACRRCRGRR